MACTENSRKVPKVSTFITAVRDGLIGTEDWQASLRERLAETGTTLDGNEIQCEGAGVVGFYEFVSREEAARQFGACPWFTLDPAPWVGGVAGFFSWSHVVDEHAARYFLIPQLLRHGRGVVARLREGSFLHVVRQKEFCLDNLVKKHGFDDGEALLFREGPYVRDMIAAIDRKLSEAGFDSRANVYNTHHNPVRLARELRRDGVAVADPEKALAPFTVESWAFDWKVLEDKIFWID
jgi:hypothetical protein